MRRPGALRLAICALARVCLMAAGVQPAFAAQSKAAAAAQKPARAVVSAVSSPASGKLTVKVKKAKRTKGYQYMVATNKKFTSNVKKKTTAKRSITFSKLKAGKTYYVKVRAYGKASGKSKWGAWSKIKSKKVKAAKSNANASQAATPVEPTGKGAVVTVRGYGSFTILFNSAFAPKTVENFKNLASSGFYDGLTFHRIVAGFALQGGDPEGTGMGGSDTPIVGEFSYNGIANPLASHFMRGVVAMARAGNNYDSATSQFFITLSSSTSTTYSLNDQYAAFGTIDSAGMAVVDAVVAAYIGEADPSNNGTISDKSRQPVIESIRII